MPCCGVADADNGHARTCRRGSAQVNQHQPLVDVLPRTFKRLNILHHAVEDGPPWIHDVRMDLTVTVGGLGGADRADFRHKELLVDTTLADPQATGYPRRRITAIDTMAAPPSEVRKSGYYERPGQVLFDACSHKLVTLAGESCVCLGKSGHELVDQLTINVVASCKRGSYRLHR